MTGRATYTRRVDDHSLARHAARVISLPTHPIAHYAFDALAWGIAFFAARSPWHRAHARVDVLARIAGPSYFISLAVGGIAGAWLFGSATSLAAPTGTLSHSIAGALAGGIIAVELWKWRHGVTQSTGGPLVLPLVVGIVIGRWGCLFSGLSDGTFGTPSTLPWAVDMGDGIARHPVQIYESLAMLGFACVYLIALSRQARWARIAAFHVMIIFYAGQRFLWEFWKPYPRIIGPLDLFQLLCLGMMLYGSIWISRSYRADQR